MSDRLKPLAESETLAEKRKSVTNCVKNKLQFSLICTPC